MTENELKRCREKLAKAVQALEAILDYKCVVGVHRDYDDEAFMCREIAKTALAEITKGE